MLIQVLFYVFAAILVLAALGVITSRNPVYSALALVVCFVTAAAIWLQKNRAAVDAYPESWMRVEAIRRALFDSAALQGAHPNSNGIDLHLGRGKLHAGDALTKAPEKAHRAAVSVGREMGRV